MGFRIGDALTNPPAILFQQDRCPVGKVGYRTKREAADALKRINNLNRSAMQKFRCHYCDMYHLGHRR